MRRYEVPILLTCLQRLHKSFRKRYGYKIKSTDENTNRPENTILGLIKSSILTCSSLCRIFIYYLEIKSNLTGQKLLKVGEKQIISSCTNKCFTQQKLCKTKQTSYDYVHVLKKEVMMLTS